VSTMRVTNLRNESSAVDQIVLNADGSFGGELGSTLGSKLDLAGGKILQIVRATDTTQRSTTSTSFVDASLSVTITPQKNDSAVLLLAVVALSGQAGTANVVRLQITDNSNNPISGAEGTSIGVNVAASTFNSGIMLARDTPATINATTYKLRFCHTGGGSTAFILNTNSTGQLYAIEVSA